METQSQAGGRVEYPPLRNIFLFKERKERETEKEVCAKCYCRDEGKDPPGGGGSPPRVTSSETASKLGIHTAGSPWGPRETNGDLNQRRHEHDLGRGLFLGEGIRGYRRRIRGGAAD